MRSILSGTPTICRGRAKRLPEDRKTISAPGRDIYIEFLVQGALIKTTAIDSVTGTEVCIFGPRTTPRDILIKNAVSKLEYVQAKKKS